MIEMRVMGIALDTRTGSPIVVLNDKENRKALPIWIGAAEASALIRKIEKISSKSYMYNNNQEDSFNAKIYIFEYKNKAEIILPSTNLTANGITNNYSNITIISYELPKDEELYNDYMFSIKEYIYPNLNLFDLIDDKKPMTYHYYHSVIKGNSPKASPSYVEPQ